MKYYFIFTAFIFSFGAIWGSFLNAIIYRIPRDINIAIPRSFCPKCEKKIFWYENIPVLSYIFLKGKCSECKCKISPRYPLIELLSGLVAVYLFPQSIDSYSLFIFAFQFAVFCVLCSHFFIDLDHKILPDSLNLYLAVLFLSYSITHYSWKFWLLGGVIGFFVPLAFAWGYYLLRKKEGFGGGDIKLLGALGLYLGPMGIIYNILFSSFIGSIVGISLIVLKKMDRDTYIPFGPFIIIVALIQIFFPELLSGIENMFII